MLLVVMVAEVALMIDVNENDFVDVVIVRLFMKSSTMPAPF
jgi:hypothetical protein